MDKIILNVVLGFLGIFILFVFAVSYGTACIILGWVPDLSFGTWALITGGLTVLILAVGLSLWFFTEFKEGIHGWILIPGLFLGRLWVNSLGDQSFQNLLTGVIYIAILFLFLACVEMGLSWYLDQRTSRSQRQKLLGKWAEPTDQQQQF